jgi:hypothetical protein
MWAYEPHTSSLLINTLSTVHPQAISGRVVAGGRSHMPAFGILEFRTDLVYINSTFEMKLLI